MTHFHGDHLKEAAIFFNTANLVERPVAEPGPGHTWRKSTAMVPHRI
jgi:hypothetical protein